jgi:2,4-dienoyl-CoA reductase-like NADH-dependent reductase (Old Yellow Enzyme family)
MIDRTALGEPLNVVLDEQSDPALFKRWAEAGTANGTRLWMQLNHPGKQIPNLINKEPVAPSAVPLGSGLEKTFNTPRALTEPEIEELIRRFGWAAGRAKDWGFDGVQIHGAHGYLVNQFLSGHHNRRDDQWAAAWKIACVSCGKSIGRSVPRWGMTSPSASSSTPRISSAAALPRRNPCR